jgi:hypothetical protein
MQRIASDRMVFANNAAKNTEQQFVNNEITNTKYTPLSFIPKTLMEQFRQVYKYCNVFLGLSVSKTVRVCVGRLLCWSHDTHRLSVASARAPMLVVACLVCLDPKHFLILETRYTLDLGDVRWFSCFCTAWLLSARASVFH